MPDIADLMEDKEAAEAWCKYIAGYSPDKLIVKELFQPQDIRIWTPRIQKVIDAASDLLSFPLELLPESHLGTIRVSAKEVAGRLLELEKTAQYAQDRSSEQPGLYKGWDTNGVSFMGALLNNCETFTSVTLPAISYLAYKTSGLTKQSGELERSLNEFGAKAEEAIGTFRSKEEELEGIIKVARETAAQAGVSQHAQYFANIAQEHAKASKKWLISAVVLLCGTVALALLLLFAYPTQGEIGSAVTIQRIIGKAVAVSILYYGAVWSAKNYRTHRHLSVLNSHRQSALNTFDAFIKASSGDEQTKNAVLLEATRCIFAPANTGYLGADDDGPSDRIIEIFKTVGSSAGSK